MPDEQMSDDERRARRDRKRVREHRAAALIAIALFLVTLVVVVVQSARGDDPPPPPPTYQGLSAEQWATIANEREHERDQARSKLGRRERELRRAHRHVTRLRRAMRARVSLAGAGAGTHGLLCIHQYEGAWDDDGSPYWGGLQMDLAFQRKWGEPFLREWGTADHWPPYVQVAVGLAAYTERGFSPWPNTRRPCGV